MLTPSTVVTLLDLRGKTVTIRCAELFLHRQFRLFTRMLAFDTYLTMVVEQRSGSIYDGVQLNERVAYAEWTLRDCHHWWFMEESRGDREDGLRFFQDLVLLDARVIRSVMSDDVEQFWASQGMLHDGGFMRYLGSTIELIRQLLGEKAGSDDDSHQNASQALEEGDC